MINTPIMSKVNDLTHEQHIADKQKAISDIEAEQKEMILKAAELAKTDIVAAMDIVFRIRMMEVQKHIIATKPIPRYPEGGRSGNGLAVIGESTQAEMITVNGKTFAVPVMPGLKLGIYPIDGRPIEF
jgi:hypothetical protein